MLTTMEQSTTGYGLTIQINTGAEDSVKDEYINIQYKNPEWIDSVNAIFLFRVSESLSEEAVFLREKIETIKLQAGEVVEVPYQKLLSRPDGQIG